MKPFCSARLLFFITLFSLFFSLGSRSLNEPDEGRYAEIAREMVESGNWMVPHFWYVPHLDKPPLTYWIVAISLRCFGLNEWAVRIPVALAGFSGIWAIYLLGLNMGGKQVGMWSALILLSSLLYFVMSRFLTADIFLTQFIAWAMYCGWRSWRSLDAINSADEERRAVSSRSAFFWQCGMWVFISLGFLVKGPIAGIIPLISFLLLFAILFHSGSHSADKQYFPPEITPNEWNILFKAKIHIFCLGSLGGIGLLVFMVLPWFVFIWQTIPGSFHYMTINQFAGHALGTAIKNRGGPIYYFVPILLLGALPWTPLLGWVWSSKKRLFQNVNIHEGKILASAWITVTFILFSLSQSKLPAYILPLFPGLALLLGLRWFSTDEQVKSTPPLLWKTVALLPCIEFILLIITGHFVFQIPVTSNMIGAGIIWIILAIILINKLSVTCCPVVAVIQSLLLLYLVSAYLPLHETKLQNNQTLKPLAQSLKAKYQKGEKVVAWGYLPQGFPFYAAPIINATNRAYIGGYSVHQVPFQFSPNIKQFGDHFISNHSDLLKILSEFNKTWIIAFKNASLPAQLTQITLTQVTQAGRWELLVTGPLKQNSVIKSTNQTKIINPNQ